MPWMAMDNFSSASKIWPWTNSLLFSERHFQAVTERLLWSSSLMKNGIASISKTLSVPERPLQNPSARWVASGHRWPLTCEIETNRNFRLFTLFTTQSTPLLSDQTNSMTKTKISSARNSPRPSPTTTRYKSTKASALAKDQKTLDRSQKEGAVGFQTF